MSTLCCLEFFALHEDSTEIKSVRMTVDLYVHVLRKYYFICMLLW